MIDEKYLVEIKPKKLHGSRLVQIKKKAAENYCLNNNLIYKLVYPIKLLTDIELKTLIENKKIEFTERYKEKWELWKDQN